MPQDETPTPGIPRRITVSDDNTLQTQRFNLRRHATLQICLLIISATLIAGIAVTALYQQNWIIAAATVPTTAIIIITARLILRTNQRQDAVERWARQLSSGNYDHTITLPGDDPLSRICIALETLRIGSITATQHELEKLLAEQRQPKTGELEPVAKQPSTTQQQATTQQKLANLGEMASGVAHELRNPLSFVQNFAEDALANTISLQSIITTDLKGDPNHLETVFSVIEEIRTSLQRTVNNTYRADEVVTKLIGLNRASPDSAFQTTHLPPLITQQVNVAYAAHFAESPHVPIELIYDYHPDTPETNAIPRELAHAVYNIVSNSTAAITQRQDDNTDFHGVIRISTHADAANIFITISDNGVGIEQTDIHKVFTPFYTTKSPNQGTALGLGMSIAFDIAHQHRGHIEIASEPNSYTTVTLTIPRTPTQPTLDMEIIAP